MPEYTPRKGDFITLTSDQQSGHEQKDRRPALVVSNDLFNQHTGLAIVCPLTNTKRDFPFHVPVLDDSGITGSVMVEQVKSIDFRARGARRISRASGEVLDRVPALIDACIY